MIQKITKRDIAIEAKVELNVEGKRPTILRGEVLKPLKTCNEKGLLDMITYYRITQKNLRQ